MGIFFFADSSIKSTLINFKIFEVLAQKT